MSRPGFSLAKSETFFYKICLFQLQCRMDEIKIEFENIEIIFKTINPSNCREDMMKGIIILPLALLSIFIWIAPAADLIA